MIQIDINGRANKHIEDIQWLDIGYGMHFTSKITFLIFTLVRSNRKSCVTSEINSKFNLKAYNFLFITFYRVFEHVTNFQILDTAWNS